MSRAILLASTILAVFAIWIIWGMAGPRISEIFLAEGQIRLPAAVRPPLIDATASTDSWAKAGQWGDAFGALNSLFAGLAFVGALAALFMQGQVAERQNKDSHRQRFESSYFELLALLRDTRRDVRFRYSLNYRKSNNILKNSERAEVRTEVAAFRAAIYELRYLIRTTDINPGEEKEKLEKIYRVGIHSPFESTFGPYFRIIYTIMRRIKDDNNLTKSEKAQYGNLLRSQLTSHELTLAGFNGLMPQANDFNDLLTEFHMLKYLPKGLTRRALEKVYSESAFAARND